MNKFIPCAVLTALSAMLTSAFAQTADNIQQQMAAHAHHEVMAYVRHKVIATMQLVTDKGIGKKIGTVTFADSNRGLVITPDLSGLPAGSHGFHIHEKGSCEPALQNGLAGAALAAGGHYNPQEVPHHGSPLTGHMGDLPVLLVNASGHAETSVLAPRLKVIDIRGLALIIHEGGDNYSDIPAPLGGGGNRIACGVIP